MTEDFLNYGVVARRMEEIYFAVWRALPEVLFSK